MPHKRKNAKHPVIVHGLYADIAKRKLDGRTKVVRAMREARAGLAQLFPGGQTNAAAALLIDRIIFKALKLSLYEAHDLKGLEGLSPGSEQGYLNMSNSLREDIRLLTALAQRQSPGREAPDLEEYLQAIRRAGKAPQVMIIKGENANDND
jgi:hypothetical protein